jgi:hypothetical protein
MRELLRAFHARQRCTQIAAVFDFCNGFCDTSTFVRVGDHEATALYQRMMASARMSRVTMED